LHKFAPFLVTYDNKSNFLYADLTRSFLSSDPKISRLHEVKRRKRSFKVKQLFDTYISDIDTDEDEDMDAEYLVLNFQI